MSRSISTPPSLPWTRRSSCPTPRDSRPIELIGLKTYPLPPKGAVEFKHSLKPGRYLADFSLVRVGIAESVPPPRLVIGFGKDRRTVDAVRVQDETVVYRYWLKVAEGDNLVHVALAPGQAESANVVKPSEIAANVSGDQRYGGNRGLHVDSMVVRGPVPLKTEQLPESHRRILFCTPEYGDQSRLDCARQVIARVRRTGVSTAGAARRSGTSPPDLSTRPRPG